MEMEMKNVMRCAVCFELGSFRCSSCKMVHYCGRDCQTVHFPSHKRDCRRIDSLKKEISREEILLRNSHPDVFETSVGRFWEVPVTQYYMESRYRLFHFLERMENSYAALLEAIELGKDLLRLWRKDGEGVRIHMAVMYLQLNSYESLQNCYDHIKWFDTYDMHGTQHDMSDLSLPYLDIIGADMCEDDYALSVTVCLYNMVALVVIKMRLLYQLILFTSRIDMILQAAAHESSPMLLFRCNQGVLLTLFSFLQPSFPCFAGRPLRKLKRQLWAQFATAIFGKCLCTLTK